MADPIVNKDRRRFLTGVTTAVGGVGVGFAMTPFVLSMTPSERAKNAGAPVKYDFGLLEPGQMVKIEWRGQPVAILKRTPEMMATLSKVTDQLADPDSLNSVQPAYAQNEGRSDPAREGLLVMLDVCTHLGCSPTEKLAIGPDPEVGDDWMGGFFCPCHGSKFDLAGRVYKNVPAVANMLIPPFQFLTDTVVLIGEDDGRGA